MANAAKPSSRLKILYGEGNSEVLASQAATMQKAGHEVTPVAGRKPVEEALRQGSFDLVVLGGTLSRNDRHHLPYMVKKVNTGIKVAVMHTDGERHPCVDGNIDTGRSVADLLAKIAAMWSNQAVPAAAKGAAAGK